MRQTRPSSASTSIDRVLRLSVGKIYARSHLHLRQRLRVHELEGHRRLLALYEPTVLVNQIQ
jgi:hypothetical protein